jgi:hypothetical protein
MQSLLKNKNYSSGGSAEPQVFGMRQGEEMCRRLVSNGPKGGFNCKDLQRRQRVAALHVYIQHSTTKVDRLIQTVQMFRKLM